MAELFKKKNADLCEEIQLLISTNYELFDGNDWKIFFFIINLFYAFNVCLQSNKKLVCFNVTQSSVTNKNCNEFKTAKKKLTEEVDQLKKKLQNFEYRNKGLFHINTLKKKAFML